MDKFFCAYTGLLVLLAPSVAILTAWQSPFALDSLLSSSGHILPSEPCITGRAFLVFQPYSSSHRGGSPFHLHNLVRRCRAFGKNLSDWVLTDVVPPVGVPDQLIELLNDYVPPSLVARFGYWLESA